MDLVILFLWFLQRIMPACYNLLLNCLKYSRGIAKIVHEKILSPTPVMMSLISLSHQEPTVIIRYLLRHLFLAAKSLKEVKESDFRILLR